LIRTQRLYLDAGTIDGDNSDTDDHNAMTRASSPKGVDTQGLHLAFRPACPADQAANFLATYEMSAVTIEAASARATAPDGADWFVERRTRQPLHQFWQKCALGLIDGDHHCHSVGCN
jgi:hypothetical protein